MALTRSAGTRYVTAMQGCKFAALRAGLWFTIKIIGLDGVYTLCKFFGTCEWLINHNRRRRFHERMRSIFKEEYDAAKMRKTCR